MREATALLGYIISKSHFTCKLRANRTALLSTAKSRRTSTRQMYGSVGSPAATPYDDSPLTRIVDDEEHRRTRRVQAASAFLLFFGVSMVKYSYSQTSVGTSSSLQTLTLGEVLDISPNRHSPRRRLRRLGSNATYPNLRCPSKDLHQKVQDH